MTRRLHFLNTTTLIVLGAVLLLLAVNPATAPGVVAAVVLLPVVLFGFVLVPLALGPALDWEPRLAVPVTMLATLFQRPPPAFLQ